MTNNEIMQALEEILELMLYEGDLQRADTVRNARDLIILQRLEIEGLNAEIKRNWAIRGNACAKLDELEKVVNETVATYRAEAIKEFAERLKGELTEILMWYEVGNFEYPAYDPNKTHNVINNLVKEMVGDYNDG